ncbi:hypothetical protein DYB28_003373 [Aphanomyces astaci]|uniref:Uncharacterized protein n=1 Tax=Aphanomyces astaci TaxID=112090 RepID=A0A9X8EA18_APHAT|nr:hypothetical protein DYB28_003373 [Aphanomyces astaci]
MLSTCMTTPTKHDALPRHLPDSPVTVDCDSLVVHDIPSMELDVRVHGGAVQFTTATTFTFPLTYGGSALPKDSGPPIGMAMNHVTVQVADATTPKRRRSRVRKFSHLERIELLKAAEITPRHIAAYCAEAIEIRASRAKTLRYLKRRMSGDLEDCEDDDSVEPTTTLVEHKRRRMYIPALSELLD